MMPQWKLFVYGSLKRGEKNFVAFCGSQKSASPATIVGRLYRQRGGYPMLVVPPASILALGSSDLALDARMAVDFRPQNSEKVSDSNAMRGITTNEQDDWHAIEGELLTFDDWSPLVQLDELEVFLPGRPSLYHRVICAVWRAGASEPDYAWTYVAPDGVLPDGCVRMGNFWSGSLLDYEPNYDDTLD